MIYIYRISTVCDYQDTHIDCLLYYYMLTHDTKLAEIDFLGFLTIFEYAQSNTERWQAQIFMQRHEP